MKVSLNTIRNYIDFELPSVDELVQRINSQLGQIEHVDDFADKYKDVIIVKVVSAVKHPDADRLTVCMIDDGGVVKDLERSADGLVQVVCGAPNVREGIYAAWLPPRAVVPSTYGTDEPFVLDARDLRGVKSNGMLAAADELALGSDHGGIIEIDPAEWRPTKTEIVPGASFAQVYGLDDTILEIENKMFTHRPDLFGQIGIAREIAGILGYQFTSPEWYLAKPDFTEANNLPLTVVNDAREKCARFMAVAIKDVKVGPSPLWLQIELVRLGSKPINNIVDATNYVMLLTAQPTHAYDYDKLRGNTLGVRMARSGEACTLLNGKSYTLTDSDIVIVDGEGVVGLGGVMGGGNSEVSSTTTNIVLEVAHFDMYTVRKTSMRYGLFTDAVTRFTKGQSALQNDRILNLLMMSIKDVAGGEQATAIADMRLDDSYEEKQTRLHAPQINKLLGSSMSVSDITQMLARVEFSAANQTEDSVVLTIPFWRTDIAGNTQDNPTGIGAESTADLAEEVGRLYGFENLPYHLPMRRMSPAPYHFGRALKQRIREVLRRAGANEALTYSFVHERLLKNAAQDVSHAYKIANALSPDLQYYRLSVLPSLLDKIHMNIKAGFDTFALFEIGKGHSASYGMDEEGLPKEAEYLDMAFANKQPGNGAAYYQAWHMADFLFAQLGIEVMYSSLAEVAGDDVTAPFEANRSASIEAKDGTHLGVVGELKAGVRSRFKLPEYSAAVSIEMATLLSQASTAKSQYASLSRFPSISRDVSLRTDNNVEYAQIYRAVQDALAELGDAYAVSIEPLAIYQSEHGAARKTTTFHIEMTHDDRTMTDEDVAPIIQAIAQRAKNDVNAELI